MSPGQNAARAKIQEVMAYIESLEDRNKYDSAEIVRLRSVLDAREKEIDDLINKLAAQQRADRVRSDRG